MRKSNAVTRCHLCITYQVPVLRTEDLVMHEEKGAAARRSGRRAALFQVMFWGGGAAIARRPVRREYGVPGSPIMVYYRVGDVSICDPAMESDTTPSTRMTLAGAAAENKASISVDPTYRFAFAAVGSDTVFLVVAAPTL